MSDSLTAWVQRYRLIILMAVVALGAFLRLYKIDTLPPGDGYDVAQYGLDALQILDGARPIFLAANFGREVLFSYLVALVYVFSGPGALGIHLSSALIGIATIPAVYLAARQLLFDEAATARVWVPLLAALVTAVSYWHINYSRAGLRVIWVPLFAALITAALWHGLQRGSRTSLAAAGILLGLSQYTYQAARLLPLLVLAGFLFTYASRRSFTRRDLADMLLSFGLALLVFAPLGLFAARQPEIFNDRLRQTALLDQEGQLAQQLSEIGAQTLVTARMFFIEGDSEPLYTIPGRPSLNPFLAAAFLAGIAAALWRWKRPAALYLLAWLLLLTAPAMIADQAATAKRALGALPAAAILIAAGLTLPYFFLLRGAGDRGRRLGSVYALIMALGLIVTAVITFEDYFQRWGQDSALAAHFERDHTEIGLAAGALSADDALLISPFPASHPAIQLNSGRHPDMRSYDGHRCLIISDGQDQAVHYLIVPGETETSLEQLQMIFPGGTTTTGPQRPDRQEPYYEAFHVPAGEAPHLDLPDEVLRNWGDKIELLDIAASPPQAAPGEQVSITMTYRAAADMGTDYTAYIHLLGEAGELLSQVDSQPCGGALATRTWREGDIIRDTVQLSIAEGTPPGSYEVAAGFYTWPDITPLAVSSRNEGPLTLLDIR